MTNEEPTNYTKEPPFGINGIAGLLESHYYWCRLPDGTKFISWFNAGQWWTPGNQWAVNITRDQVICEAKVPEN